MRSVLLTVGACVAVVLVSGCQNTRVAGVHPSQEEEAWEKVIRRNYPNYRPPRAAAPAVVGNTEERVSAPVRSDLEPMDAPAEKTEAEPNAGDKDAPKTEPEIAAPAVADAPTEVKTEPAKAEPAKAEPAKTEPAKAEPAKTEPAKAEPAKTEPEKAKPAKVAPPDPTNSTVYEVRSGDTLGKISQKHYGSARYANVIFKANGDILKDPNRVRPGMKLIIPKL